jgi:hypothetical protein
MNEPDDAFSERFNTGGESTKGDQKRYPEEDLAENVHDLLTEEVGLRLLGTVISLTPMGVNSYCEAKRGERACTIYCFATTGPQFLVRFDEKPTPPLWGRTFVQAEVIGAVRAWLERAAPADACSRFPFIGRQRRVLGQLRDNLIAAEPALAQHATYELISSECGDGCALWFRTQDRACDVYYYAYNGVPDAEFYWNQCLQFGARMAEVPDSNIRTEDGFLMALRAGKLASWNMHADLDSERTVVLAGLMKRWLCDQAMPSAIQHKYPWIVLAEMAWWYEQGRGVEGEFIASWRSVKELYQGVGYGRAVALQVLQFIDQLSEMGYDRTLRAGTSMYSLLVSRSRRHGLRHTMPNESYDPSKHDPYIAFCFGGLRFNPHISAGQMEVNAYLDDGERIKTCPSIVLTAELKMLLDKLQAIPIR